MALSEKISGLLNTAPISFDPEDDIHQETTARVVSKGEDEDSDEDIIGKFRKQNVALLEDVDQRYEGKKGTRKKLVQKDWGSDEDSDLISDTKSETEEGEEPYSGNSDIDDDAAKSDDSASSIEDDNENKEASFKHIEEPDATLQIQKGQSVRQQLSIWENLLEMRIQFQKCLIAANSFSLPSADNEFNQVGGTKLGSTRKTLTNLLDKLLYLQLLLVRKCPETKSLFQGKSQTSNTTNEDDEEIPSDTEDEQRSDAEPEELPKKKRKLNYTSELSKRHSSYKNYRDSIIHKWNDKTKTVTTKTNTASHSVLKQIEHILNDKDKLIKRTQLNRIDNGNSDDLYNPEVFDDTDFYHQLLRELIEYKSADLTDPVQLGRQWVQLQNLRSKMKRKIDTRATKGRKIRYTVHSKLVNFMAPVEDIAWQTDTKTELYSSLFGKNQPVNKI